MAGVVGNPRKWDPNFLRTQLLGVTAALVLSVGALRLFRAYTWPGEYGAQWAVFYTVMGLTAIRNAPRGHRWRALWRFVPIGVVAAALTAWMAMSAARP